MLLDVESLPRTMILQRQNRFKNGDFEQSYFNLQAEVKIKSGKQRKWRDPSKGETKMIRDCIYDSTPNVAYFPTFVFDFPKRIFLTRGRGDRINLFYKRVFQDILDYDGQGHIIDETIVRRVRSEDNITAWADFLSQWNSGDDKNKVQHVIDRASSVVTKVVFGRWNEIFGEQVKGKEIQISFELSQGLVKDSAGQLNHTDEHDAYVAFQIKDGTRRFDVKDRSLGFRWFFAFMLFTQFRVARERSRPVFFLFDEPASNLHSAAQQKLIESFPEIAKGGNTLAYTTHSRYLIEPKWLEQTFIVTNRADAPDSSLLEELSLDDESLDIKASRYRQFVSQHPNQVSYFQPILGRLDVVPSKFDFDRRCIVLEGKSDYYILRYAIQLLNFPELPLTPGLGTGTFDALISIDVGWNLKMIFLLDGDKEGKDQKERYLRKYALQGHKIVTLSEIEQITKIEDLLDEEARSIISKELSIQKAPSKKQILSFFQERLASDNVAPLSDEFASRSRSVLEELQVKLKAESSA